MRGPRSGRAGVLATLALIAALTLAGRADAKAPVFGIVPQDGGLPSASDLDIMPPAGITGMRVMLPWGAVEQTQGAYDWTGTDEVIRQTTSRGIQPFFFLYGTPTWAARKDGRDCPDAECAVYPPKTKATRAAFGKFAAAAAARYGPGGDFWEAPVSAPVEPLDGPGEVCPIPTVCPPPPPPPPPPVPDPPLPTEPPCKCTTASPITVWQIWNEQNSPKYFAPEVDVRSYARLLKSAADGIRSVDSNAEIVLGGMWGPHSAREVVMPANDYLTKLYDLGAADDFDSIAIHPYANNANGSVAQLRSARHLVKREDDAGAGMWVTEVGWAGRGPTESPYVKGLVGQARVLTRALSEFKREAHSFHLRGVFWYSWRDKKGGDTICDWCGHAGLRAKNGSAKPAWQAFVRVARP